METSRQFTEIIGQNFPKCPSCKRNPILSDSPVSRVDNKTKVCMNCKGGEATRDAILAINPTDMLVRNGSTTDLFDSYGPAREFESTHQTAQGEERSHAKRVKNSNVPLPEPTKIGNFKVTYERHKHDGEISATAEHPNGWYLHHANLDHETGEVRFGAWDSPFPPQHVQNHIKSVLTKHWRKHIAGK
jgi:hypothetical protein